MHQFPEWRVGGLTIDISSFIAIIVSCVIVYLIARLATRNMSVNKPSRMQNFLEWAVDFVRGIITSTMPLKQAKTYLSLGLTLMMFILVSNLLGLPFGIVTGHYEELTWFGYPIVSDADLAAAAAKTGHAEVEVAWWKSPTADLSVTSALAVIVIGMVHYLGITRNTKHYFKHYLEPFAVFLPLNILKELSKPLTLALRLFANIFAGEVLISTILMAGVFGTPLLIAWQGFSIFVGAIQAFLFTILTMVYIAQATVHEEHEH